MVMIVTSSVNGYIINTGDSVFAELMWMKTLSVYLVVQTGHSVLFMDADIAWLRDPVPFLLHWQADKDLIAMDDGAR